MCCFCGRTHCSLPRRQSPPQHPSDRKMVPIGHNNGIQRTADCTVLVPAFCLSDHVLRARRTSVSLLFLHDQHALLKRQYKPGLLYPMQIALRKGITNGNLNNEALRAAYERHNEHIQSIVPPERLLLWGPQDGWEPLCKFLELPVPSVPMPFVNESKAWTNNMRGIPLLQQGYSDGEIQGKLQAPMETAVQVRVFAHVYVSVCCAVIVCASVLSVSYFRDHR